jgi:hypothetical protein
MNDVTTALTNATGLNSTGVMLRARSATCKPIP